VDGHGSIQLHPAARPGCAVPWGGAKQWGYLAPLALLGTSLLYASWFAAHFDASKQFVATAFAFVYYALFVLVESEVIVGWRQLLGSLHCWPSAITAGQGESWIFAMDGCSLLWPPPESPCPSGAAGRFRPEPTAANLLVVFRDLAEFVPNSRPGVVVPAASPDFALFLGYLAWRIVLRARKPARMPWR